MINARVWTYLLSLNRLAEVAYNRVLTVPFSKYKTTFAVSMNGFCFRPLYLQECYMALGLWEPYVKRELKSLLSKDSIFIDIGAYIGCHTVYASRMAREVFCFEPNKETYKILGRNCRTLKNVYPCHSAVGSTMASVYLRHDSIPSLSYVTDKADKNCELVNCMTLDSLLELNQPIVVKIDAEGREIDVLEGGLKFISQKHPDIIVETARLADADRLLQGYGRRNLFGSYWVYRAVT